MSISIGERLAAPFPAAEVRWKPQTVKGNRALALAYIDARMVQDRLDEVLGVDCWEDEYEVLRDGGVVCRLRVRFKDEWLTKCDVGSPSEQPDSHDRMKAAFSDALKRAAVKFGVGRYLYGLDPIWVAYDPQKKCFTETPQLPAWAKPKAAPATQAAQQQAPAPVGKPVSPPPPKPAPEVPPPALDPPASTEAVDLLVRRVQTISELSGETYDRVANELCVKLKIAVADFSQLTQTQCVEGFTLAGKWLAHIQRRRAEQEQTQQAG